MPQAATTPSGACAFMAGGIAKNAHATLAQCAVITTMVEVGAAVKPRFLGMTRGSQPSSPKTTTIAGDQTQRTRTSQPPPSASLPISTALGRSHASVLQALQNRALTLTRADAVMAWAEAWATDRSGNWGCRNRLDQYVPTSPRFPRSRTAGCAPGGE